MSLLMDALKKAEKVKQDADQNDSPAASVDAERKPVDENASAVASDLEESSVSEQSDNVLDGFGGENEQVLESQTEVPVDAQSISLEPRPDLEQTIITPAVSPVEPVVESVVESIIEPVVESKNEAPSTPVVVEPAPVERQASPTLTLDDAYRTEVNSNNIDMPGVSKTKQQAGALLTEKKSGAGFVASNMVVVAAAGLVVILMSFGGYSYYQSVSAELQLDINRAMDTVRRQQNIVEGNQVSREVTVREIIMPVEKVMAKKPESVPVKSMSAKRLSRVKTKIVPVKKPVVRQQAVIKEVKAVVSQVVPERKSPSIKVKRQLVPDNIYAILSQAYSAYQSGDDNKALLHYTRVLEIEFNNRDALLGLAAISIRNSQYEKARDTYLNLIENNPRDSVALSGLLSIQSNVDPDKSETQIKLLLDKEPGSSHLLFTLGSLYAAQQRWAEAQDAFFRAYSSESNNADFAYNLAVSLDQLEQRNAALRYYRTALELVKLSPVTFNVSDVMSRINVLQEVGG